MLLFKSVTYKFYRMGPLTNQNTIKVKDNLGSRTNNIFSGWVRAGAEQKNTAPAPPKNPGSGRLRQHCY